MVARVALARDGDAQSGIARLSDQHPRGLLQPSCLISRADNQTAFQASVMTETVGKWHQIEVIVGKMDRQHAVVLQAGLVQRDGLSREEVCWNRVTAEGIEHQ